MKIRIQQDTLLIDNSAIWQVLGGIVFLLIGVGIVGVAVVQRHGHAYSWWIIGLGAVFVIVGACVAAFSKSTHVELAKSGDSHVATKRLLTNPKTQTFALTDIASVLLESNETRTINKNDDGSRSVETYLTFTLYLVTRNAKRIALGSKKRGGSDSGFLTSLMRSLVQPTLLKKEGEQIAKFIGVPLQIADAGTNTIAMLQ